VPSRFSTPIHSPDDRPYSIIIPSAGMGNRMKSYGPKSLIEIKEETTILENQLKYIYRYFYKPQVIVVTGFGSEKINQRLKNKNIDLVENNDWKETNVAESISIGLQEVKHKNLILLYGDLVFNAWTLKAPFGLYSMLLIDKSGLMKKEEVGCSINNSEIANLMYDLPHKWAQIAYFTGKELDMLKQKLSRECKLNYRKSFGFEIINSIIEEGGKFIAHSPPRMKISDIDSSKDLASVEKII